VRAGFWVLAVFILLRGSDSSALKALQQAGNLTHAAGPEAISFCNVFFFSSLICGMAMVVIDRKGLQSNVPRLPNTDCWLLAGQGFSGFFLGPVGFFLALNRLSVVEQTLLFSLTVPITALAAHWWLKETLPRTFPLTPGSYIQVDPLKCYRGAQSYTLPAGADIKASGSVLIWSKVANPTMALSPLKQSARPYRWYAC
jgi:hypothetical protein